MPHALFHPHSSRNLTLIATFWGTGTSTGVPMVGCDCAVCRSSDPRNHRRRASMLLQSHQSTVLIDAGPDFRVQALTAGLQALDTVLLTHAHADHILGLDDLRPLSWKHPIVVACDQRTEETVRQAFPYFFAPSNGKNSRPQLEFIRLVPYVEVTLGGVPILPLAIEHGDDRILGYRIGSLAYLTDCSGIPDRTWAYLKDLDVVVLGALRERPHPTHYSLGQAVEAALRIGARHSYFTHFSHEVDHSTWGATLPSGMEPAYDGLSLVLENL